ncbi:MAG: response regulator transcription factor [Gemmataceae bacterium]
MEKIRLLLVDDHTVVRAGLRVLFDQQADMHVSAEAGSAAEGLTQARAVRPDVVVLDLTLPGGGSLELIKPLLQLDSRPHVLVLSMHDDPAYARSALAAGASGYVVKTCRESDLLAAVRAIRRGQVFVDLDDPDRTAAVFGPAAAPGQSAASGARLSEREQEVLRLLGQGHTNQAVAEQLDISPKTVATYRARIAEKLGLKTTADFVKYAADTGFLEHPDQRG